MYIARPTVVHPKRRSAMIPTGLPHLRQQGRILIFNPESCWTRAAAGEVGAEPNDLHAGFTRRVPNVPATPPPLQPRPKSLAPTHPRWVSAHVGAFADSITAHPSPRQYGHLVTITRALRCPDDSTHPKGGGIASEGGTHSSNKKYPRVMSQVLSAGLGCLFPPLRTSPAQLTACTVALNGNDERAKFLRMFFVFYSPLPDGSYFYVLLSEQWRLWFGGGALRPSRHRRTKARQREVLLDLCIDPACM